MRIETITDHKHGSSDIESARFDSTSEFVEWISPEFVSMRAGRDAGWIGRDISDNPNRACVVAWDDGLDALDSARERVGGQVTTQPQTRRRRARFDEFDGDEICLDRMRAGAPFWRSTQRQNTNGPSSITVAVDISASSFRKSKEIAYRGLAAILLCEKLEAAGYRVELVTYAFQSQCFTDGRSMFVSTVIKSESDPLDTIELVNATSGWFYRVFVLAAEHMATKKASVDSGYGYPRPLDSEQLGEFLGNDVHVNINDVWDQYATTELVETTLAKIDSGELCGVE